MDLDSAKKKFPSYFANFELPVEAVEQAIDVYRACRSHKVDKDSFLNSYEENGFSVLIGGKENDPSQYSLSTYMKLKDVARFVKLDSRYQPPYALAKGTTAPEHGICCPTSVWKSDIKKKNSHVDWWLYEAAEPWRSFELKDYEEEQKTISNNG